MSLTSEGGAFHTGRPGIRKLLGDLEADVMQGIWERGEGEVTVREIHEALVTQREVAYTTVMTVMGNLAKKGLLEARKEGKAHLYRATQTCEQFTEAAVGRMVNELMKDFAAPALAHFSRFIEDQNR
jgi:predicted transcriptional regulator